MATVGNGRFLSLGRRHLSGCRERCFAICNYPHVVSYESIIFTIGNANEQSAILTKCYTPCPASCTNLTGYSTDNYTMHTARALTEANVGLEILYLTAAKFILQRTQVKRLQSALSMRDLSSSPCPGVGSSAIPGFELESLVSDSKQLVRC
ncbi:hypothetical protein BD289DRAFT_220380 [Coniella lustricola]|uniref:Uncharacterized protein n=1 Tax=Coniella lustricola TaxID=2025994 RepID=A0A2T3ALW6_9PEZI|nr:hypothetical protein BD289DRAFT_220380 [Coniella lustricola]